MPPLKQSQAYFPAFCFYIPFSTKKNQDCLGRPLILEVEHRKHKLKLKFLVVGKYGNIQRIKCKKKARFRQIIQTYLGQLIGKCD